MRKLTEIDLKKNLTPPQFEAAISVDKPSLILAGAGSGKTRVITYKMAYIIGQGFIRPHQLLAVTFTNKAAGELKSRLSAMLETPLNFPWMGTFHSICVRILRMALPDAKPLFSENSHTKQFSIYDDDDQKKVIRQILKSRGVDSNAGEVRKIKSIISNFKNKGILPDEALDLAEYFEQRFVAEIYAEFQKELKKQNAFDFDDLLLETVQVLKLDVEVRSSFRKKFKYGFVDEFQDTNPVQYELIKLLLGQEQPNLTVVGDDDQSIYGWRGADLRILQNYHKDFEGATVFKLEENFRSSANIVQAAGSVIAHNERQEVFKKKVFSTQAPGEKVVIKHFEDEPYEANQIALNIALKGMENYSSTAIFYRTNAQSRLLEDSLRKRNIPYRLVGGMSFFQRKEIKDILAYLRFLINPADDQSFLRIINTPKRGIGATTIAKLQDYARLHFLGLGETLGKSPEIVGSAASKKLLAFAGLIQNLQAKLKDRALPVFIEELIEDTSYQKFLEKEGTDEAKDRLANLEEFISAVVDADEEKPGITLDEFLQEQALVSELPNTEVDVDSVVLMTLHASKGLEFPFVHITGCVDGVMPLVRDAAPSELEEERRLFYVGATRAEKELSLYTSRVRRVRGQDEVFKPSRFLDEIDLSVCEITDERFQSSWQESNTYSWRTSAPERQSPFRKHDKPKTSMRDAVDNWQKGLSTLNKSNPSQETIADDSYSSRVGVNRSRKKQSPDSFNQDFLYLDVGSRVVHPKYGPGVVLSASGSGDNTRVEIRFNSAGIKKLVLKFANLKVIA